MTSAVLGHEYDFLELRLLSTDVWQDFLHCCLAGNEQLNLQSLSTSLTTELAWVAKMVFG